MRDLLKHGLSLGETLNSPFLVERIQNYYGVHRLAVVKNGHTCKSSNGAVHGGGKRCSVGADSSVPCRVERRLWYYVFRFGSLLGYEAFYASFFPFILWNWDAVVCRRVLFVWAPVMYCGGLAKDLLRWPRPASPPVVQFDRAYAAEFGMPSTHAMTGASVPFGLLLFTQRRYEVSCAAAPLPAKQKRLVYVVAPFIATLSPEAACSARVRKLQAGCCPCCTVAAQLARCPASKCRFRSSSARA